MTSSCSSSSSDEAKRRRYDVFISFNGGQLLDDESKIHGADPRSSSSTSFKVRQLIEEYLVGGQNILQQKWKARHEGTRLSVFTDQRLERDHGRLEQIFWALLQTFQGGGVIVLLLTPGYFTRKWCLTELKCAYNLVLAEQTNQNHQHRSASSLCRLCFISLGMDVKDIANQPFVQEHCPSLLQWNVPQVDLVDGEPGCLAADVADKILGRCGSRLVPGDTQAKTLLNLRRMVGQALKPHRLVELKAVLGDVPDETRDCKTALLQTQAIHPATGQPLLECLEDWVGDDADQCLVWMQAYLDKWQDHRTTYGNWDKLMDQFRTELDRATHFVQQHQKDIQIDTEHGMGSYSRILPPPQPRTQDEHRVGQYFRVVPGQPVVVYTGDEPTRRRIAELQQVFDARIDIQAVASLTASQLTRLLDQHPEGTYSFRLSQSFGLLVVQVRVAAGACNHILIQQDKATGQFGSYNTSTRQFDSDLQPSIAQLITHSLPECRHFLPVSASTVQSL